MSAEATTMRFRLALLLTLAACKTGPEPGPAATTTAAATESKDAAAAAAAPLEPSLVTFESGSHTLHGFLYRPAGPGPFPAVVFNHGSEPLPGTKAGQAAFFVPHGYVLFVPHRRGHGQSRAEGDDINKVANDPPRFVAALEAHAEDVSAAIAFIATQPFVDAKRIAVSGCSLGGIQSLFAAEREPSLIAAIDFAGASAMWNRTPPLRERMKRAAREAKVPVFFIQAENDYNTAPSRILDEEMRNAHKPSRLHIFPPNGTTADEGHGFCAGGPNPAWGPEVLQFLEQSAKR